MARGRGSAEVVGRDGTVLENISGYGEGDRRLEQALDRHLGK